MEDQATSNVNRILEAVCHTHIITVVDADDWGIDTRPQTFHLAQGEHFVLRCLAYVNSCNQFKVLSDNNTELCDSIYVA